MDYKWYIVNAVSGCENSVCKEINKLALTDDDIKEAFVPVKRVFKIVKGKKVEAEQKLYPAYVFVNMICNNKTLGAIRSIPKALGFLGGSKYKPDVVSNSEIEKIRNRMVSEASLEEEVFDIGDKVKIVDGPFDTFVGTVDGFDKEKNILKVSILIFGRTTVVDIDKSKVEKI
jgi:transcriptional antiterminator NusG